MAVDMSMPILIVDDYKTMLRIMRNLLNQLGFNNVDEATDGSTALQKLRERNFGLVISDWNMEPMTGLQLLQGSARRHEAEGHALHHGHRREQDRERRSPPRRPGSTTTSSSRSTPRHSSRRSPASSAISEEVRPMAMPNGAAPSLKRFVNEQLPEADFRPIDRDEIEKVVQSVVATLRGDMTAHELSLYAELEGLSRFIRHAKAEIAALRPDENFRTSTCRPPRTSSTPSSVRPSRRQT